MTSTSSAGASVITLQFNLDLSLDVAEQEVQAAINAASNLLPNDLPAPPVYAKVNPADAPILTLAVTSKTLPLTEVRRSESRRGSRKRSRNCRASAWSRISGGQRPAVRVRFDPRALAALWPQHRRSAHDHRQRQRQHPEGQLRRPDARLRRSTPTTS